RPGTARTGLTSGAGRSRTHATRVDGATTTTSGPSNTRTRIVGNRDGVLADLIVVGVRSLRAVPNLVGAVAARIGSVITPLGWSMGAVVALSFLFGHLVAWPELLAVAYTGTVLLLVAVLYLVGRNAFTIDLSIPHSRVVVGDRATARITIGN